MRWSIVGLVFLAIIFSSPLAFSQSFSTDKSTSRERGSPYCKDIPEDVKPHCAKVLDGNFKRALKKLANVGPTAEIKDAANKLLSVHNRDDKLIGVKDLEEDFESSDEYASIHNTSVQPGGKEPWSGQKGVGVGQKMAKTGVKGLRGFIPTKKNLIKKLLKLILVELVVEKGADKITKIAEETEDRTLEDIVQAVGRMAKEAGVKGSKCFDEYFPCTFPETLSCVIPAVSCFADSLSYD